MKQGAVVGDVDIGTTEFPMVGGFNGTAELVAKELFAVADAKDGNAKLEHHGWGQRRYVVMHRGGTAGQDDPPRAPSSDALRGDVERPDFAVDAGFA